MAAAAEFLEQCAPVPQSGSGGESASGGESGREGLSAGSGGEGQASCDEALSALKALQRELPPAPPPQLLPHAPATLAPPRAPTPGAAERLQATRHAPAHSARLVGAAQRALIGGVLSAVERLGRPAKAGPWCCNGWCAAGVSVYAMFPACKVVVLLLRQDAKRWLPEARRRRRVARGGQRGRGGPGRGDGGRAAAGGAPGAPAGAGQLRAPPGG